MKVCDCCGEEFNGRDGDNRCLGCEVIEAEGERKADRAKRNRARRARDHAMRDLGLVRVKGACGGVYWE